MLAGRNENKMRACVHAAEKEAGGKKNKISENIVNPSLKRRFGKDPHIFNHCRRELMDKRNRMSNSTCYNLTNTK